MIKLLRIYIVFMVFLSLKVNAQSSYDVCVYGGTSGGVTAAYTAKMMGKSVLLIEPGKHLGGLSSGGLGYTDIGNKYAVTGLGLDFYRRTGKYYGQLESWIFEPHVAENIFMQYINKAHVPVLYQYRIISAKKVNRVIKEIVLENSDSKLKPAKTIRAKVFIDCSYEGDLMAKAGVSYKVGREDASVYGESYNGVQVQPAATPQHGNQIPDGVDPYKTPGDPKSGLLWGISNAPLASIGTGDNHVQAYNFRICLTDDPANRITIAKPPGYDPVRYELLPRYIAKLTDTNDIREILKFDLMPNHKTDINNGGGFSTDMIGYNWDYPNAGYKKRAEIQKMHELYDKGLLYFIQHDPRIPAAMRNFLLNWGYPKDEYQDNHHWSPQMYVREARRMIGEYVMTQANCERREVVPDGIGMAAYGMDSHNTQRLVINGMAKNEGDVEKGGVGPYPIAYRALTPKRNECTNLLVPVCLSASHIGYGSIRMEPVFMVLGQSSATAAVLSVNNNAPVQDVDVSEIQKILKQNPLVDGSLPEMIVDNSDQQHVELTGDWALVKGGFYGPNAYISNKVTDAYKAVKFTQTIPQTGYYEIYTYVLPKLNQASSNMVCIVNNGSLAKEVVINHDKIMVRGQTSGEWVSLGRYQMLKGNKASVTITNKNADGAIAADAVLFYPSK
ncbi:FAD-dependent oxidoreductase [Mucilaginibacter sabulilitoris]|uniref:FAD-dependent oxidoreductase n=1 Tax=Mucilaginibacter sabulilitoris TaxID=1173583 RepID=A0ABZ0TPT8_9SPHI|nr:FAD-dependent oxidoreductase [Mucilaginibacter sabulilitoris]WPU93190.1 FAD-dependent oxidoreductase [Mucilaginibacter sabulilitoris]